MYHKEKLIAKESETFITFFDNLIKAVHSTKNCLLVSSILESFYSAAYQKIIDNLKSLFNNYQKIWEPDSIEENQKIVLQRLFEKCYYQKIKEDVTEAYGKMYHENKNIFPQDVTDQNYKIRFLTCYPIHPLVFDCLYKNFKNILISHNTCSIF